MADRMVAAGLIERRSDAKDNRLVRLWLTDRGRELQKPVEAERRALEEVLISDLTADERAALMNGLSKVLQAARGADGRIVD